MATKNLGSVKAIYIQSTAPSNTDVLWRDTSVTPRVTKYYDTLQAAWVPVAGYTTFNYTWANLDSGTIKVGTTSNDVIQLEGALVSGTTRTKVVIVVTHNGTTASIDAETAPFVPSLAGLFTGAIISSGDILLSYDNSSIGASVNFKGQLKTF